MKSSEYMQLALECVREADATVDENRKTMLLDMAKMYNRMALKIEAGPPPVRTESKSRPRGNRGFLRPGCQSRAPPVGTGRGSLGLSAMRGNWRVCGNKPRRVTDH